MADKKPVCVCIIHKGELKSCVYDPGSVVVSDVLALGAFGLPLDYEGRWWSCTAFGDEPGATHRWDFNGGKTISEAVSCAITLGAAGMCPPRAGYSTVFLGDCGSGKAEEIVRVWRTVFFDKHKHSTESLQQCTTTAKKKPVGVYIIRGGVPKMCMYHPDNMVLSDVRAKEAFGLPRDRTYSFSFCIARGDEPGESHRQEFAGEKRLADALFSAIALGAATCPPRAPYAFVLLGGGSGPEIDQLEREWRALFDDVHKPLPLAVPVIAVTPLMRWYDARKEYKEASADLLSKLNAALVEKAKDPALNGGVTVYLDPVISEELDRLADLEDGTVFNGHPIRIAAYEAVGLVFEPPIPQATHELAGINVRGGKPSSHQFRRVHLPWRGQK